MVVVVAVENGRAKGRRRSKGVAVAVAPVTKRRLALAVDLARHERLLLRRVSSQLQSGLSMGVAAVGHLQLQ